MAEEEFKLKSALLLPFPFHQVCLKTYWLLSQPKLLALLGVLKAVLRWSNSAGIDMQIRTLSLKQKSAPSFISVLKK